MSWGYKHEPKRIRGAWIASFEELVMRLNRGEWIWIDHGWMGGRNKYSSATGRPWHAKALLNWQLGLLQGYQARRAFYECQLNPKNWDNQREADEEAHKVRQAALKELVDIMAPEPATIEHHYKWLVDFHKSRQPPIKKQIRINWKKPRDLFEVKPKRAKRRKK